MTRRRTITLFLVVLALGFAAGAYHATANTPGGQRDTAYWGTRAL